MVYHIRINVSLASGAEVYVEIFFHDGLCSVHKSAKRVTILEEIPRRKIV
jgi:hypothetical protein